jgi:hypothetical protein
LEEEVPRSFETIVLDTLPSQLDTAIDLLPACDRAKPWPELRASALATPCDIAAGGPTLSTTENNR